MKLEHTLKKAITLYVNCFFCILRVLHMHLIIQKDIDF